jgi:hypothetical protein
VNDAYIALSGRIRLELVELERVAERTRKIWTQAARSPDDFLVDAAALNLHSFYSGLEHVFESIATLLDHSLPTGDAWHVELLRQMAAELPGVRPPVVSREMLNALDRYRGFRHVVRNVYTYRLDARQIAPLVEDLEKVEAQLRSELNAFADRVEMIGAAED